MKLVLVLLLTLVSMYAGAAPATPTGVEAITAAVDFADVLTGIAAIAGLLAAVMVLRKGARFVLGFLR